MTEPEPKADPYAGLKQDYWDVKWKEWRGFFISIPFIALLLGVIIGALLLARSNSATPIITMVSNDPLPTFLVIALFFALVVIIYLLSEILLALQTSYVEQCRTSLTIAEINKVSWLQFELDRSRHKVEGLEHKLARLNTEIAQATTDK